MKKTSIRSQQPCNNVPCFMNAPVVATEPPPPPIKLQPLATLHHNKTILCTMCIHQKGQIGLLHLRAELAGFQCLLQTKYFPVEGTHTSACLSSQSMWIEEGLLLNLFFLLIQLQAGNSTSLSLKFSLLLPNSQHLPAAMKATCMTGTQGLCLDEAVFFISIILAPKTANYSENKRQCQKESTECIRGEKNKVVQTSCCSISTA